MGGAGTKTVVALLLGIALGAGAMVFFVQHPTEQPAQQVLPHNRDEATPATIFSGSQSTTPSPNAARNTPPLLTFKQIADIHSGFQQNLETLRLLEGADADALVAFLEEAQRTFTGNDRRATTSIIIGRLAELEPERALELALKSPLSLRQPWIYRVFHAWASQDLEAARNALTRVNTPYDENAKQALLTGAEDHVSPDVLSRVAGELNASYYLPVAEENLAEAWDSALKVKGNARRGALYRIAMLWAGTDPQSALEATNAVPEPLRQNLTQLVMRIWAQENPGQAAERLASMPQNSRYLGTISQVIGEYAKREPLAAQLFVETFDNDRVRQHTVNALAQGLIENDINIAIAWFDTLEDESTRLSAISQISQGLVRQDDATIDLWLDQLTGNEKASAAQHLYMMGGFDPDRFTQRVEQIADPELQRKSAQALISSWANQNPGDASRWISRLPKEHRATLYGHSIREWAQWDFEEARQFTANLRDVAERDSANTSLITGAPNADTMEQILQEIDNPESRVRAATNAYHRLRNNRDPRANEFAEAAGIDLSAPQQ